MAGRTKGAKSTQPTKVEKLKQCEKFSKMLEDENYNPLMEALRLLKKPIEPVFDMSLAERVKLNLEICSYIYPKLKSIEVDSKTQNQISIVFQKFGHLVDERAGQEVKILESKNQA